MMVSLRAEGILGGYISPRGSSSESLNCGGVSCGVRGPNSGSSTGDCGSVDFSTGVVCEAETLLVCK